MQKDDGIFDTDLYPETEVEDHTSEYQMVHLRCYAHSLQLAVKDGLQELKPIYRTMAKCSKISSLLHSSTTVQVGFQRSKDLKYRSLSQLKSCKFGF